jgi:hypothetical protein
MRIKKAVYNLKAGDTVYLTSELPTSWANPGRSAARLLWIKQK